MSACEDNCCRNSGWTISVDPVTYAKYKAMDDEMGEFIRSCIVEEDGVAKMKEFDDGKCPLLVDGLCRIHRDLGAEYLCTTCTTYPRVTTFFNKRPECWLSLSCPEVVRWVLYRKETTGILEFTAQTRVHSNASNAKDREKSKVREFLFDIAKCEKYSFMEKLIYMGLFMRSISKLPLDSEFIRAIKEPLETYRGNLGAKSIFSGVIDRLKNTDDEHRANMLLQLSGVSAAAVSHIKKVPEDLPNASYYKLMETFYSDVTEGNAKDYLVEAFDRLIVPYVNDNAYVFNNYLTYVLLSSQFLADTDDFAEAYAGFIGEICAMLIFTAGLFHENTSLSHEDMVVGIYLFHRRVSHSKKIRNSMAEMFKTESLAFLLGICRGIN